MLTATSKPSSHGRGGIYSWHVWCRVTNVTVAHTTQHNGLLVNRREVEFEVASARVGGNGRTRRKQWRWAVLSFFEDTNMVRVKAWFFYFWMWALLKYEKLAPSPAIFRPSVEGNNISDPPSHFFPFPFLPFNFSPNKQSLDLL